MHKYFPDFLVNNEIHEIKGLYFFLKIKILIIK